MTINITSTRTVVLIPATVRPDMVIAILASQSKPMVPGVAEPVMTIEIETSKTLPLAPNAAEPDMDINIRSTGRSLATVEGRRYRLEVRDAATGDLVAILADAHGARMSIRINEPTTMSFRVPSESQGADEVDRDREIWLRDLTDDTVLEQFDVLTIGRLRNPGAPPMLAVECISILARLGRYVVKDYVSGQDEATLTGWTSETPPDGSTWGQAKAAPVSYRRGIEDLLAFQDEAADPILLATASYGWPDTEWTGNVRGITILEALGRVRQSAGGFFRMQPGRRNRLLWTPTIEADEKTTRRLRAGVNVASASVETDFSELVTRLIPYGAGEGEAQLTLLDAGHPTIYLDADTVGTYGVVTKTIEFVGIDDPDRLMEAAAAHLERHKHPIKRIVVEAAELSPEVEPV
jgi:hypothetical protein